MKIEKISDTQIKFLLTNDDLEERQIKLSELAQGTEKAQAFFRDIMTEAMIDCGFDASNTPLMIEAMPVAMDSVMIIVSKVVSQEGKTIDRISLPESLARRKFKQQDIKIIENGSSISNNENNEQADTDEEENVYIYSFIKLDDIISLSERLYDVYKGKNVLYKYEDRYFLSLQKSISFGNEIDYILSEYGQKHVSTIISKYYLEEHGETIIKENAIEILSTL